MMEYFAIKHIPTGFYLPQSSRKKQGYSWDEPTNPADIPPRIFKREQDAKCALKWWLQGVTSVTYRGGGFQDMSGEWDYDAAETWTTKMPDDDMGVKRRAEDMVIVKFRVEEVRPQ